MALDSIRLTAIIPASPERVYTAWLDSKEHTEFTGGGATIEARVGGQHTAWDGYIWGRQVELIPGRKIVQTWRTSEFPQDAKDSRLELLFERRGASGAETTLTLIHTEIPVGQGAQYKDGWGEHYFEPMRAYFRDVGAAAPRPAPKVAPKPAKNAAARKAVAKKPAAKAPKTAAKKPAGKAPKKAARKPAAKAPAKKPARTAARKKAPRK